MNRNTNTLNSISKRWNVVFNILLTLAALTMLIPLALLTALSVLLGMFPQVLTAPLDALVAALM